MIDEDENKIFVADKHYILIYPSEAIAAGSPGRVSARHVKNIAHKAKRYLSRELNCEIHVSEPEEPILLLQKNGMFWKVIIGEKIGWIIVRNWLRIRIRRLERQVQK